MANIALMASMGLWDVFIFDPIFDQMKTAVTFSFDGTFDGTFKPEFAKYE